LISHHPLRLQPPINVATDTGTRVLHPHDTEGYLMKKKKMVPIQFPANIMEMLENWESCPEENVGW
jgi:hypothetical protein